MDSVSSLLGVRSLDEEASLIKTMSFAILTLSLFFLFFTVYLHEAPYGRYARQYKWFWGCQINSKIGWFVQELPSLVIPILCLLLVNEETSKINNGVTANSILLACFIAHYIHRLIEDVVFVLACLTACLFVCL